MIVQMYRKTDYNTVSYPYDIVKSIFGNGDTLTINDLRLLTNFSKLTISKALYDLYKENYIISENLNGIFYYKKRIEEAEKVVNRIDYVWYKYPFKHFQKLFKRFHLKTLQSKPFKNSSSGFI